jgi:hypothetical protein
MANPIGDVIAGTYGIHFQLADDVPPVKKYGKIPDVFVKPGVAMNGHLTWIGMKIWII